MFDNQITIQIKKRGDVVSSKCVHHIQKALKCVAGNVSNHGTSSSGIPKESSLTWTISEN